MRQEDLALVQELSQSMVLTSICGLGQVVPAPIGSVLKYFREEVEAHIARRECPSGICFSDTPARSTPAVAAAVPRLL